MENLITHLQTILTLIVIFWVITILPWLVGRVANRYLRDESKESYFKVWGFGMVLMMIVSSVIIVLSEAYILMFSFYNH